MSELKFNNKYRIPSARWVNWDYGREGAYYVTICTKNRKHYFGEIVDAEIRYSELGNIAVTEWLKSAELRPDMQLDMASFQVMPNHIHGIVVIGRDGPAAAGYGPQSNNLASVMRGFKSAVTTQARKMNIPFEWQPRFHDRVIRDDDEFRRIADYIEQNPQNWEKDKMNDEYL